MFIDNKNFYPTPKHLINKMCSKIDFNTVNYVLEPSAGKGDIIDFVDKKKRSLEYSMIELDTNLQAILKQKFESDKNVNIIDSDFLKYPGGDMFDLIIANPPFDSGEYHLLKAIEIMYSGQIVFLLNAETLKNPYSNIRKSLLSKLEELNADIEYLQDEFLESERKTAVEVALIYINIKRDIKDDLLKNMKKTNEEIQLDEKTDNSLTRKDDIHNLVERYNITVKKGIESIKFFYSNYSYLQEYLSLSLERNEYDDENLNYLFSKKINNFIKKVRNSFWHKALNLEIIRSKLTETKMNEFKKNLQANSTLEFSETNIKQFVINIARNYRETLEQSVNELFKKMTSQHAYYPECKNNILHFNGWKTNNAYKVQKKVILPYYDGFFDKIWDTWKVSYSIEESLNDIDKVMYYFSGIKDYISIVDAVKGAVEENKTQNIISTFFKITIYKKNTIHLTFLDKSILRRFNVMACKNKEWLPHDYSTKSYDEMSKDEKGVVNSFENEKIYTKNLNKVGFAIKNEQLFLEN